MKIKKKNNQMRFVITVEFQILVKILDSLR